MAAVVCLFLSDLISHFQFRLPCGVSYFCCFQLCRFLSFGCLGIGDSDFCGGLDLCDLLSYFIFRATTVRSWTFSSAVGTFCIVSFKYGLRFFPNLVTVFGIVFTRTYWAYWAFFCLVACDGFVPIMLTFVAPYGVRYEVCTFVP